MGVKYKACARLPIAFLAGAISLPAGLALRDEEVRIPAGEIFLAGTLSLPTTTGRHPAVVLLNESGRDEPEQAVLGFKPYRVITEHLFRTGIAVLRYDKRGAAGAALQRGDGRSLIKTGGDVAVCTNQCRG